MRNCQHLGLAAVALAAACTRDVGRPPLQDRPAEQGSESVEAYATRMRSLASRYRDCWAHFNAREWEAYKACYTPMTLFEHPGVDRGYLRNDVDLRIRDALEYQEHVDIALVVPTETDITAIVVMTRNTRAGHETFRAAHVITFNGEGDPAHDRLYFDAVATASVSAAPEAPAARVVVGVGSKADEMRARVVEAMLGTGDYATYLSPSAKWHEAGRDLDKAGVLSQLAYLRGAMPRFRAEMQRSTFAEGVVVVQGNLEGRNDNGFPALNIAPSYDEISVPFVATFEVENEQVTSAEWFWQESALVEQLRPRLFTGEH